VVYFIWINHIFFFITQSYCFFVHCINWIDESVRNCPKASTMRIVCDLVAVGQFVSDTPHTEGYITGCIYSRVNIILNHQLTLIINLSSFLGAFNRFVISSFNLIFDPQEREGKRERFRERRRGKKRECVLCKCVCDVWKGRELNEN